MDTLPPLSARISRAALRRNFQSLRSHISNGSALSILVKSDAYGHGMETVAKVATEEGCAFLLVASLDEALRLRQLDQMANILIIGPIFPDEAAEAITQDFSVALGSMEIAKALSAAAVAQNKKARVHIKFDTGMGRFGFLADPLEAVEKILGELKTLPGLMLDGVMTHFSEADDPVSEFTEEQMQRFEKAVQAMISLDIRPRWIHASNSGAAILFPKAGYSMCRMGISMFGVYPGSAVIQNLNLEPVMSLVCRVADLRQVPANTPISYSRTYITKRSSRLALLPVGYGHGYPRHASGKAHVMIHGQLSPVLGRITMNLIVVDVTDIADIQVGDPVLLFGRLGSDIYRVEELAAAADTIPYEIVCNVGRCAPRVVVDE